MQKSLSRLFPVLVAFISLAGCGEDAKDVAEEQPLENTEALCSGNIDNDQNGLIDCKDLGCSLFKHCQGTSPETPKLENTEALCSGEVDNDEDGMADCEDPDCAEFKYCLCHNDKDDDGDYETDCEDEDCDGYCDDADDPDWS